MSGPWRWVPSTLAAMLRERGFDVDAAAPPQPGGSLVARRERGEQAVLVAVDAGGRVRVQLTRVRRETVRHLTIAATELTAVETDQVLLNVTGTLPSVAAFAALLDALLASRES